MPTVLESISTFLRNRPSDLTERWTCDMETQVKVVPGTPVEDTRRFTADGFEYWNIRIPANADSVPEWSDYQMSWPLEKFIEGIGCTGWDWRSCRSRWVGFDFDAITGHAAGVGITPEQLERVKEAALGLPWVEVRKSTSGKGLHLYVMCSGIATSNHTEHAAAARAVLGMMSTHAGFDFASQVDACGGNMWIWHRKMTAENGGLQLIKAAERTLTVGELPVNWREAAQTSKPPVISSVKLSTQHNLLIALLARNHWGEWDEASQRINTHTAALKHAHAELEMRGEFETLANGSELPHDRNCFAYPRNDGAWAVYRHGQGTQEHSSWKSSPNGWTSCNLNERPGRKGKVDPAARIVQLALAHDELFHGTDGVAYVNVNGDQRETLPVADERYVQVLRLRYTDNASGAIARQAWISNAVDQLKAIAMRDRPEHRVHLRVAEHAGKVFIDLADKDRNVVEVSADGWQLTQCAPVRFCRPASMLPLATPVRGGNISELRRFVNIDEHDWPLFVGGLVTMFHPTGPYPVMMFYGSPGSGKSLAAGRVQDLVDATIIGGTSDIQSEEDLLIVSRIRWLMSFDNLSVIDQRSSDILCRLSTGSAHARRKKYSDADASVFAAKRPTIITAVADVIKAPDLVDRALRFELPVIAQRRPEQELRAEFAEARGRILGALLDGVASALRNRDTTKIDGLPRLADFAIWATAAEEGLGLVAGSVMEAYRENSAEATATILDEPFARGIVDLAKADFSGTMRELAEILGLTAAAKELRELGGQLRYLVPALDRQGAKVSFSRSHGRKLVKLSWVPQVPKGAPGSNPSFQLAV